MNSSYSIKYILLALAIDGGQAMNAFANMSKMGKEEKQKMRTSLIEYCKLDTLEMVKILEKLKGLK